MSKSNRTGSRPDGSAQDDLSWLRSACVQIYTPNGHTGSGYIVASDKVATCAHIIQDIRSNIIVVLSDESRMEARVIASDQNNDVAILQLMQEVRGIVPLVLKDTVLRDRPFLAYGFIADMSRFSLILRGTVLDPVGRSHLGISSIVLEFNTEVPGGSLYGFSGSPVVVDGVVVGHLSKLVIKASDNDASSVLLSARMGICFAVPARYVLQSLGDRQSIQLVQPPGAAYSPQWYIPRIDAEDLALTCLTYPGIPCVLYGPLQSGKSWLMAHVIRRWKEHMPEGRSVVVDLLNFDHALKDLSSFVDNFARMLMVQLEGDSSWFDNYSNNKASPMMKLGIMLRRHFLDSEKILLLAIDTIDTIIGRSYINDFLGSLRAWMQKSWEPPWDRLRLLLVISTTPTRLIDNPHQSPFNIAHHVEVPPFSTAEIQMLALQHGLTFTSQESSYIQKLTGGNPYLIRRIMFESTIMSRDIPRLREPPIEAILPHLRNLLNFMRVESLEKPLAQVLRNSKASLTYDQEERLRMAGLVRRNIDGQLEISCLLYQKYFSEVL